MEDRRMWKLPIALGVNVLLGIPAIVPLFLAWLLLVNGPLASLGWTVRDPNEDDGMLVVLVFAAPFFLGFGLAWGLVNWWMRRRTDGPAFRYWLACATACLAPYVVLLILS